MVQLDIDQCIAICEAVGGFEKNVKEGEGEGEV
jgi:hypothetical protein|nr:MAG TPA: hypothetical protein [Caudoviricetes sp.]